MTSCEIKPNTGADSALFTISNFPIPHWISHWKSHGKEVSQDDSTCIVGSVAAGFGGNIIILINLKIYGKNYDIMYYIMSKFVFSDKG